MDANQALDLLKSARGFVNEDPEEYTRQYLLVDKSNNGDGDEYEAGEVPLHSNIQIKISKWVLEQFDEKIPQLEKGTRSLAEYSVENAAKKNVPIQYIKSDNIPLFDRFKSIVNGNSFDETTYAEEDDPSFQVFRAIDRLHQRRFAAFRVYTQSQIIGKSWKITAALRGSEYDTFEEELVALPNSYDVMYYDCNNSEYNGEILFIFNPGYFEKIFDYFETYEENARNVFNSLEESNLIIHNLDEVKNTIMGENHSLRKMSVIEKRGVHEMLTLDRAEEVIDEYGLNLEIEKNSDGERGLKVPDLRHRHDLLRLLNDDHLTSELTDMRYQVHSKEQR